MALSQDKVSQILIENNLKKDIYRLIKHSDEVKEMAKDKGNILNRSIIIEILQNLRTEGKIIESTTISNFIKYNVKVLNLFDEVVIFDERKGTTLVRYVATYTFVSPYEIALSLLSRSFLSHYSALYINDLTINNPKNIYINKEQSKKKKNNKKTKLTQGRIDYAFSKKMRSTNMTYNFNYHNQFYRVHVLNSKNTNKTGVITKHPINFSKKIQVTNIERSLIDTVVRPKYSGGVSEILEAYTRAKSKLKIKRLVEYLDKFDYTYPYYKSILLYLKFAKYPLTSIGFFENEYKKNENDELNFYLDYQMIDKKLDKKIGIYYPKFLD